MNYPEHEKLIQNEQLLNCISEFCEWLESQGYEICKVRENQIGYAVLYETLALEKIIADFLRIDAKKLETEKQKMLAETRASLYMPKRIQFKRQKGFKLPENCVRVTRPSAFGNPFKVGEPAPFGFQKLETVDDILDAYEDMILYNLDENPDYLESLRGKVILSGYASPLYTKLFDENGWRRLDKETLANGAARRTESLWINF